MPVQDSPPEQHDCLVMRHTILVSNLPAHLILLASITYLARLHISLPTRSQTSLAELGDVQVIKLEVPNWNVLREQLLGTRIGMKELF